MVKCYKKGYFRPQFVREAWTDLNGEWEFAFDDADVGERDGYFRKFPGQHQKIAVPYSYETPASGVADERVHNVVWYRRTFRAKAGKDERFLLHFEGADYGSKVWVNGALVGVHEGGYCRFTLDVTDALTAGENVLTVRCEDSLDARQPRGKQRWLKNSFGCWYVQTTGLWKPVWAETVPAARLEQAKFTPDIDGQRIGIDFEFTREAIGCELLTEISFGDTPVASARTAVNRCGQNIWVDMRCDAFDFRVKQWSPCDPNLYDVTFTLLRDGKPVDRVGSYFGMRCIEADEKGIRINHSPLYQKLVLAQNYWKETGLTLPGEEAALKDVELARAAGFNGMRIHQKIEDERFLFVCDVKGMLVWGEFPAQYEFGDVAVKRLTAEWSDAVRQQYNHPCIIAWVPFNESWGIPGVYSEKAQQEFTRGIYHLTKAYDTMRPVVTNDGWEHTCSDIITLHDYDGDGRSMAGRYQDGLKGILSNKVAHGRFKFAFAEGNSYCGQPVIVSEYGGIALAGGNGWGYNGKAKDAEALISKYDELTSVVKAMPGVSGYCYTQLTDTYQEVNGLLDENHEPKVDLTRIREINDR